MDDSDKCPSMPALGNEEDDYDFPAERASLDSVLQSSMPTVQELSADTEMGSVRSDAGSESSTLFRLQKPGNKKQNSLEDIKKRVTRDDPITNRKNLTLSFTPRMRVRVLSNAKPEPVFPENTDEFWTSGNVRAVGDTLLVKRHREGIFDYIHMAKITSFGRSTFKFPTSMIDMLISRMEYMLKLIEVDEDNNVYYPGITEPTPYDQLADERFWNDDTVIKLMKYRLRPFISQYGKLCFRMLMEVPEQHKRYNMGKLSWSGPSASISFDSFRELLSLLREIKQTRN